MTDAVQLDDLARREIIRQSRRLVSEGLVVGTAGNISLRTAAGLLITPSGLHYDQLAPRDICAVDLGGTPRPRTAREPSSETFLHLAAYEAAPDARAVVHFHGLSSTAVANTREELPVIHYYAVRLGGPVPVVPYTIFGSHLLAESIREALQGRDAALMANHGAVVVGPTLESAFANAVLLEWLCELYVKSTTLGKPRVLTEDEIAQVASKYATRAAAKKDS